MKDRYGRDINYMRISVTDRCNLRCVYCMPEKGIVKQEHDSILRNEEILEIVAAAGELGISKIRITGGEPLVRRGIAELCYLISKTPGISELGITTNGQLLPLMASELKDAGVTRVNISIDTLDAQKYSKITRGGDLYTTIAGIQAAKSAGLTPVKLNTVLINGFNDMEIPGFVSMTRHEDIEVRFIELMPIGEGIELWEKSFLPNNAVLDAVPELVPADGICGGVAKLYRLVNGVGRVGLINPVSSHFCAQCNKLRLTSDGRLKPCLHSSQEISVRGLQGENLICAFVDAVNSKPSRHGGLSTQTPSSAGRHMNRIGG